jgi:hypothetical protein
MTTVIRRDRDTRAGDLGRGLGEGLGAFFQSSATQGERLRQEKREVEKNERQRAFLSEQLEKRFTQEKNMKNLTLQGARTLKQQGYELDSLMFEKKKLADIERLTTEHKMDLEKAVAQAEINHRKRMIELETNIKGKKDLTNIEGVIRSRLQDDVQEFQAEQKKADRLQESTEAQLDRDLKRDVAKYEVKLRTTLRAIKDKDKRQLELNKQFQRFMEASAEMGEKELKTSLGMFEATAAKLGLNLPTYRVENPWLSGPSVVLDEEFDEEETTIESDFDEDGIRWTQ